MKQHKNYTVHSLLIAMITMTLATLAAGKTIYVDDDAAGANDGSSWENAYIYLQEALADADNSDKPVEIRVAQGTYKPNGGIVAISEFNWRELTFQLIKGVTLAGGYAGTNLSDPNARDIRLYETILSGDLNNDDVKVADPCDLLDELTRAENSYHVVTSRGADETAMLDGFIITAGSSNNIGGGMLIIASSPSITNCIFLENFAQFNGGGMLISESNPNLINCLFSRNSAYYGGGVKNEVNSNPILDNCTFNNNFAIDNGGGMHNITNSNPKITGCTFNENSAHHWGGGMYNSDSNPNLTNCRFIKNSANTGSGMYNYHEGAPLLVNCIFYGNVANSGSGGGMNNWNSNPVLNNCTFASNLASAGGGMNNFRNSHPTLVNCILWSNNPDEIYESDNCESIVRYSNIQGGWEGLRNIDSDPLFADPNNGEYHLKSQAGRWDPNSGSWVVDDVTSPCIDAGDPNSDYSGEIWPHGERINIGAYGGTSEASMSTRPEEMSLPKIAYIYESDARAAESFLSLLVTHGCPTTLIKLNEVSVTSFDSFELIIVADDTYYDSTWEKSGTIEAMEDSGKPIIGLGDGGYDFFGELDLSIGNPYGGHGSKNGIRVIDPEYSLFSTPYPISIPDDGILQLYTQTDNVSIYLWPEPPETVTVFAWETNDKGYYPLVMEHNRYLLWGFTESPEKMTEVGKTLFVNVAVRAANSAW